MREYIFGRLKDGIVKNMKNAIQPISRQWSDKVKKLDIPDDKRKFHCLRHTFCVRKYHQCRDLYEVQMLMGHSDIQQTQKYAKLWHNLTGKLEVEFPDITPRNITSGTPERDAMDKTQFNFNYLSRIMRM